MTANQSTMRVSCKAGIAYCAFDAYAWKGRHPHVRPVKQLTCHEGHRHRSGALACPSSRSGMGHLVTDASQPLRICHVELDQTADGVGCPSHG